MKNFLKNFTVVITVLATCLGFASCNNDNPTNEDLVGKWIYMTDTYKELLIIKADNSVISSGQNGQDLWIEIAGNITIEGNQLTYIGEDGRNFTGTFKLEENKLVINENGKEKIYNRLTENFSMEGKWTITTTTSFITTVLEEVILPVGSVNGEVIPTSVKTSNFSGQFVNWAIAQYFGNPEFTNSGEMKYVVIQDGQETIMSKNYQIENNLIGVNGKVGTVDINNSFMIFQSQDGNQAYLIMEKENVANMFVGYGLMLSEGNVGEGDNETLKTFKQSFMDAFGDYTIIIAMSKQ